MMAQSEDHYLLLVGRETFDTGCLQAITAGGNYCYDSAMNAADAIELAERRRPSLILLNLNDSARAGLDVCRELVAAESTRDVPILAIAGPPDNQFMIALAVMPCDVDALDREIHRIIDRVH